MEGKEKWVYDFKPLSLAVNLKNPSFKVSAAKALTLTFSYAANKSNTIYARHKSFGLGISLTLVLLGIGRFESQ